MHYYPHHIGDFVRDTARLSDGQCMAYLRLIWMYYDTEQPIPNAPERLAFQLGAQQWDVTMILEHFFELDEAAEQWHHTRCDKVIEEYRRKEERARKSANARWKHADAMQAQCERNADAPESHANQEPITNISIPDGIDTRRKSAAVQCPPGVEPKLWADFLAIRKAKRAPMTATALAGIEREATKAGFTLAQAITMSCERGWQGFRADWAQERAQGVFQGQETPYQRQMRQRVSEATGGLLAAHPQQEVIDVAPATPAKRLG